MTANHDPQPPEPQWSPEARTWASLLLFAHLFAVFVAVTTYTRPSLLQQQLHGLFAPYLRNLHLTAYPVSYPFARYHLTHAASSDVDFVVEVDVQKSDGSTQTVTLPPAPLQPLVRFRRYQALANATGTLASGELDEAAASILPKVIAGSIIKREQAVGGTLRIKALGLSNVEDMTNLAAVRRAAEQNQTTIYEAQVIVGPAGVELLKKSTTLEVAPIQGAPRRPSNPPRENAPPTPPRQQP